VLLRLKIEGFRCFDSLELRFGSSQLLIGVNGTGKSTILDALHLLRRFILSGDKASLVFPRDSHNRWLSSGKVGFEFDISAGSDTFGYRLHLDDWDDKVLVSTECLNINGQSWFNFNGRPGEAYASVKTNGESRQFLADPERSGLSSILAASALPPAFDSWLRNLVCVQPKPSAMGSISDRPEPYPARGLENFASWFRDASAVAQKNLNEKLQEALSGFNRIKLKNISGTTKALTVAFQSMNREAVFTFEELSDGQRVLIALHALIHLGLKQGSTLCIDEPDNFIALAEIQPWLIELMDQAEEVGSQLIIASHHPELINQMADGSLVLSRDAKGLIRAKPYQQSPDMPIPAAEYVARGWELG